MNSTPPPLTENDELCSVVVLSPDTTRLPFVIPSAALLTIVNRLVPWINALPPLTWKLLAFTLVALWPPRIKLPALIVTALAESMMAVDIAIIWNEPDDTVTVAPLAISDPESPIDTLPPWTEMPLVGPSDSVAVDENTKLPPVTFTIELLASCITDPPPIDTLPPLIDPIELWLIDTVA